MRKRLLEKAINRKPKNILRQIPAKELARNQAELEAYENGRIEDFTTHLNQKPKSNSYKRNKFK